MVIRFPPSKQFCSAKVSDMKSRGVTCIFVARPQIRCFSCWRRLGEEFLAVKLNPQIQPDFFNMVLMEDVLFFPEGLKWK